MNIIIIIFAVITAYLFTRLFDIFFNFFYRYQEQREIKRRLNNDIHRFKLKRIYKFAENHFITCGLSREEAQEQALLYIIEIDKIGLTAEKYEIVKGTYGRKRNSRSCL